MIALLVSALLTQAPPPPPVTPEPAVAVKASPSEPAEVKAFAQFVDRHLLTLDVDAAQGFKLRQRDRVISLRDDDFAEAFKLIPEAQTMAQRAMESLRTGTVLQIIGLVAIGVGAAVVALSPLVLTAGALIPLLVVGLVLNVAALVLVLIAVPYLMAANNQFTSAMAMYNRGLLELRPVSAPVDTGGLTIPLP